MRISDWSSDVCSSDLKQGAFDIGGPIDSGAHWRYRLTALYRDANSQFDHDRDNRLYVAPALSFVPDDSTNITLLAQYFRNVSGGSTQSFPASGTIDPNTNGQLPRNSFLSHPVRERHLTQTPPTPPDLTTSLQRAN